MPPPARSKPMSVCLLLDFTSLACLRDWIGTGITEGWLPATAALYHLAGAPDTFCVRAVPAPAFPAGGAPAVPLPCDPPCPFGTTLVPTGPFPLEDCA